MKLKKVLSQNLPFLGKYKRFIKALFDSLLTKNQYSQHGEDVFFMDFIKNQNIKISDYIYIDIGANHPTDISNTYALYRLGMRGIIIEPNTELINLFRFFRKRDKRLSIGVSNLNTIMEFFISKTPVISSFNREWMSSEVMSSIFVPVLTLDNAVKNISSENIFLVSIDVEGLNVEVIEGGLETINRSLLVCLEFDNVKQIEEFRNLLGNHFKELTILGCNIVFFNTNFKLISTH